MLTILLMIVLIALQGYQLLTRPFTIEYLTILFLAITIVVLKVKERMLDQ